MNKIAELLSQQGTLVIDVRTPGEYNAGHFDNSINMPLNELPARLDELKQIENIVVCCASGIRSQKAFQLLAQNNIDCCDGGSWLNLNTYLNN